MPGAKICQPANSAAIQAAPSWESEYAVIPPAGAPESRAAGPQICNQTVYLIYLHS